MSNNENQVYNSKILLRPSSLSELFDNPLLWYNKNIANSVVFNGNEATVLGTLLHQKIENYYQGIKDNQDTIHDYINEKVLQGISIDEWELLDNLDEMFEVWKSSYNENFAKPTKLEHNFTVEPKDSIIYLQGTVDAIEGDTIIDWKTTSKKKSSIGDYWLQLYMYAYLARSNGVDVNNVRVCYIQKGKVTPSGKPSPAQCYWYEEPIDENKMKLLIDNLKIVSKKIRFSLDNPDLVELLWNNNLVTWRQ